MGFPLKQPLFKNNDKFHDIMGFCMDLEEISCRFLALTELLPSMCFFPQNSIHSKRKKKIRVFLQITVSVFSKY